MGHPVVFKFNVSLCSKMIESFIELERFRAFFFKIVHLSILVPFFPFRPEKIGHVFKKVWINKVPLGEKSCYFYLPRTRYFSQRLQRFQNSFYKYDNFRRTIASRGALPYKSTRDVPFFRVSFFSINS